MKKRILSLFLTAALCAGMLPSALAEPIDSPGHDNTVQSDIYTINNDVETYDTAEGDAEAVDSSTVVAEANGKEYASLSEAFVAVENGGTVTLLANHVTDNEDLSTLAIVEKNLTLDLNDKTVDYLMVGNESYDEDSDTRTVTSSGNLTVIDNGTSTCGQISDLEFISGKLNIQGGIIG